jgi:hypothetical protein
MNKNENNLIQFPLTREMKNRLAKVDKKVILDFYSESITGCGSYIFTPALAYGEVPVLDHELEFLIFGDDFEKNLRKMGVYKNVKNLFNKMIKNIDLIKINNKLEKEGFELYPSYDNSNFDYWLDQDWYCSACIKFPESMMNSESKIILSDKKYEEIKDLVIKYQKEIHEKMEEFKNKAEDLFYSKQMKIGKYKKLELNIDVA